jgi:hypothetical protein
MVSKQKHSGVLPALSLERSYLLFWVWRKWKSWKPVAGPKKSSRFQKHAEDILTCSASQSFAG